MLLIIISLITRNNNMLLCLNIDLVLYKWCPSLVCWFKTYSMDFNHGPVAYGSCKAAETLRVCMFWRLNNGITSYEVLNPKFQVSPHIECVFSGSTFKSLFFPSDLPSFPKKCHVSPRRRPGHEALVPRLPGEQVGAHRAPTRGGLGVGEEGHLQPLQARHGALVVKWILGEIESAKLLSS